jgi:hypothetical protein
MAQLIGSNRVRLVAYLGLTMVTFIILAAGISNLQLKAGEILFAPVEQVEIEDEGPTQAAKATPYTPTSPQSILGILSVVAGLIVLYAAFRSPRIRSGLLGLLVFFILYMAVIQMYRMFNEPSAEEEVPEAAVENKERLPEELIENPPDLLDWVSAATTIGIVVAVAFASWTLWRYRTKLLNRRPPLEIITDEVAATLADIRSGANLRDAVMRCYYDMGQALRKGLGLVRQEGMTPREFEEVLKQSGLPGSSVEQLTRLFEKVRYGGQVASEQDKHEAVTCLEAIVLAAAGQQAAISG